MKQRIRKALLAAATMQFALGGPASAETSGFPVTPAPPPGAPNVLVIMTDDVGFAAASAFGGSIPTPNIDRLAANGLVYNNFHTTSICSPTRAALLTGRNHHAVGFGTVADLARAEPGYSSIIPKSAGTVGCHSRVGRRHPADRRLQHTVQIYRHARSGPVRSGAGAADDARKVAVAIQTAEASRNGICDRAWRCSEFTPAT